ncbi:MAG: RNA methyltransferase [Lautropia sp.]
MTLPTTLHQALAPPAQRQIDAFRFVLVAPSHAGNIGSVVRAMKTMGLSDLVVVNPRDADFVDHPQARALASGARDLLAVTRRAESLREAVADCQLVVAISASPREFGPVPRTPGEIAVLALEQLQAGKVHKVAMVFGTERTGLLIPEMALCQELISIPANPDYSSLNLSQAAQIVAFSLRQQIMLAGFANLPVSATIDEPHADHAAIERLHVHLEQALVAIGYLDPAEPRRLMPRLRRLLSRTRLEVSEVDLLRGICKQLEKVAATAALAPTTGRRR